MCRVDARRNNDGQWRCRDNVRLMPSQSCLNDKLDLSLSVHARVLYRISALLLRQCVLSFVQI